LPQAGEANAPTTAKKKEGICIYNFDM
jgi:hypothetical protein